jgi:ZPR1 zinc finger protein
MDPENPEQETNQAVLPQKTSLKREDGQYELPHAPNQIECPNCHKGYMKFTRTIYKLPDGEDILILLIECPKCENSQRDVIPLKYAFKPGIFELIVDDGDLTHKILRNASGTLSIPEFNIEIERGPAAQFMLTNLEGILLSMKQFTEYLIRNVDGQEKEIAEATLKGVTGALDGKGKFTVILEDLKGGSYIIPSNPEKLKFTEMELQDSD